MLEAEADEEDREALAQVKVWEALAEQQAREQQDREEKREAVRAEHATTADEQLNPGEEETKGDGGAIPTEIEKTTAASIDHTVEEGRETDSPSVEGHTDKPCPLCGHKPRSSDDESDRSVRHMAIHSPLI